MSEFCRSRKLTKHMKSVSPSSKHMEIIQLKPVPAIGALRGFQLTSPYTYPFLEGTRQGVSCQCANFIKLLPNRHVQTSLCRRSRPLLTVHCSPGLSGAFSACQGPGSCNDNEIGQRHSEVKGRKNHTGMGSKGISSRNRRQERKDRQLCFLGRPFDWRLAAMPMNSSSSSMPYPNSEYALTKLLSVDAELGPQT